LKVIGTHQLLFYSDYLHVLGASILTVKENTEASVFVSNEIGLELNKEKTKYMVMSRNQYAVQNHNIYHHHHVCHGVRPLVDPFRSHVSRSLFRGLPRFFLPVGE